MNRRSFFKLVAGIVVTAVVAPKTLLAAEPFQKTLPKNNEARTLASQIEKYLNLYIGEFNDAETRRQISFHLQQMLETKRRSRAINDYRVVCDESNNTPDIIDQNKLVADVYIHPSRELKYLRLHALVSRQGASFEELV